MSNNTMSPRCNARELTMEELDEVTGGMCTCGCAREGTAPDGRKYVYDSHGSIQWL